MGTGRLEFQSHRLESVGGAPLGEAPERGGGRPRDRVRVACSASQLAENNLMAPSSCRDLEQELWGWT